MDRILAKAAIFQGVDDRSVHALVSRLRPEEFCRAKAVFSQGEPGESLWIVISGKVKVGRRSEDGRTSLFTVRGPSETFGELSVFDPGPRTSTATALTTLCAAKVDRDAVRTWIADRPDIGERLMRVLARRLRRTEDDLSDLIFTDVAGRVARQLLHLAQRFGVQEDGVIRVDHDLTQEELAQLVGASRETVNKTLSEFARRGWIRIESRSVIISDSERLARRAK